MKKLLVLTLGMALLVCSHSTVKAYSVCEGVAVISVALEETDINYVWTTDRVNLRISPSLDSDIITTLEKRTKLEVLKKTSSEEWTKVKYDTTIGWVYSEYLTYKELFTGINNRWGIELTDDEIDLLAKILWIEARGETESDSYTAIIEVVFNRMYSLAFSDTLTEVLSDDNQFASWKLRNKAEPDKRVYDAIDKVLSGETNIFDYDVVYFSTTPRNNDIAAHIGNHYFCREE